MIDSADKFSSNPSSQGKDIGARPQFEASPVITLPEGNRRG